MLTYLERKKKRIAKAKKIKFLMLLENKNDFSKFSGFFEKN